MEESRSPNRSLRLLFFAAAIVAVLLFLCPLGLGIPLVDPDEGLHASIAQEMVEGGDWITPRFQGEPFLDKPILFTWTQALSLKIFGMNEAAVRLPGLLFGLAAMIAAGVIGWRIYGPSTGLLAAMLYATMALPAVLTQLPVHDVALIPFASLAILLFWEADRAAGFRPKAILTVAIGVLLGITCLTKGLVGVGLVGVAYGSCLLVTRKLTLEACLRGAVALTIAALVALPWYLAMESRMPGYLHYYFVERHLLGLATDTQRHSGEPLWYYLPILLGGAMPWILYLPVTIRQWWDQRRLEDRPSPNGGTILLWCWLIVCTTLLSLAGSKLVSYIWPVLPAIAVLAASAWGRVFDGSLSLPARRWFGITFAPPGWLCPLFLPAGLIVLHASIGLSIPWYAWALAIPVSFSGWLPAWLWHRGRYQLALPAGALVPACHILFFLAFVGPPLCQGYSARELAEHFNRQGRLPEQLVVVEQRIGSVVFYLDPQLRAQLRPGQILGERARSVDQLEDLRPDAFYALAESDVAEASRHLDVETPSWTPAGRYRLYQGQLMQCCRHEQGAPSVASRTR